MEISTAQNRTLATQRATYINALSAYGLAGEGLTRRRARQIADNAQHAHLPRVEISSGDADTPPQYAYSQADLERTWGQFRDMVPGWRRDAMERGYRQRVAALRKVGL